MADWRKHTPGPWLFRDQHLWTSDGKHLIKLHSPWANGALAGDEEAEANMRLMSAAAELLAALEIFVDNTGKTDPKALRELALGAIKKATEAPR